jgi:Domain of unknown function (DUF3854)
VLYPQHEQEWLDSKVDPGIIKLNVQSLSLTTPYEYLLYGLPDSERRNDGRLRDYWLKKYQHVESGGWWCSGVDVLTLDDSLWGGFKPNCPRIEEKPLGFGKSPKLKPIKYEHPPKVGTEIFALKVSDYIWQGIADKCGVYPYCPLPSASSKSVTNSESQFWAWLIDNPGIALTITEGSKKAGALLTAGYAAIALPGIFNGYRQERDEFGNKIGFPSLIPQLEVFATGGREINFCFDRDTKPQTIENVKRAIALTGKLLSFKGCQVSVISWDYPYKGVDDLIAAREIEIFHSLYENRISLEKFNLGNLLDLSGRVSLRVNQRYLSKDLVPPADAQIIAIKSPKGTGKTEWLSHIAATANATGQPVLNLSHRIPLARELGSRLGVEYRTELTEIGRLLGYSLCVDSLHPNANPRFNPDNWHGAIVIIDEVEQVIWHLLNSTTCIQNRVAILETFQQLLQTVIGTGGKIYLSDSDLSRIALDYIQSLIGYRVKTWVVENIYNPNKDKRYLQNYQTPEELVTGLVNAIANGEKAILHTSAQKSKACWSSRTLESYFAQKFPSLRILRIDSESIGEPNHPAFGCMGNLNAILPQYDLVIASPTIETGVSIDGTHFDSVWCLALGVTTVSGVCQTLERVRADVPRHLFAKKRSNQRIANGETDIRKILRTQHQLTRVNIALLGGADSIAALDDTTPEHLRTWGKIACINNSQWRCYRESILSKLKSEGYEITEVSERSEKATEIKSSVIETKEANYLHERIGVSNSPNLTDAQLEELEKKTCLTPEERYSLRKGKLRKRYATEEIDPELILKDDNGWYPQIQLHYFMTVGHIYLSKRDRRVASKMKETGGGKVFKPDFNSRMLSSEVECLRLLEIEQFLDSERSFTDKNLKEWYEKISSPITRSQIKAILGVSINPDKDTPIAVAQRLLKKLGLKLTNLGRFGSRGDRQRTYKMINLDPDGRQAIFERWLARDEKTYLDDTVSTISINVS